MTKIFQTQSLDLRGYHMQAVEIVREVLGEDDPRIADMFPFFIVRFKDGKEICAWPEELTNEILTRC